ncbi:MAG: invasion associated locus B family protein [Paracoccaceae bacterium]
MTSGSKLPRPYRPANLVIATCAFLGVVSPLVPAWGASPWQVLETPALFATAAVAPGPKGSSVSLSCTHAGAPTQSQSGIALRPPTPNQLVFSVEPTQLGAEMTANSQTQVTLLVDGKTIGTLPLLLALPEQRLSAMVAYDHALLSMLRKASTMELRNPKTNRNVSVSLAGFTAALDVVISRCPTPFGQATANQTQAPAQAKPAAGTRPTTTGLTGAPVPVMGQAWYGKAECQRGKDAEAELVITGKNQQQQYEASLTVVTRESLQGGSLKLALLGEDAGGGAVRFVLGQRPGVGFGFQPPRGMLFNPATGESTLDGGSCSTLSLAPMSANSPRLVSTVPAPSNGGTFYAAASARDKCEAIIAWAGKLNEEYPEIDFYRTSNTTDLAWKMIRIFADQDFVPVFGQPYDVMPYEARVEVRNFTEQECGRDPFVRDRLETYRAAVSRTITGGSKTQELTSNGYTANVFAVRKMRALRNEIALLEHGGSGSASDLKATLDSLSDKLDLLWPGERSDMEARLAKAVSDEASTKAAQIVTSALAITDPVQTIPAVEKAIARLNSELGGVLSASEIGSAVDTLKTHRQAAVDSLLGPELQTIRQTEVSLAGALSLAERMKAPGQRLSVLSDAELRSYRDEIGKVLDEHLQTLVEKRLTALQSLPATREGLSGGAAWIADFERDLAPFETRKAYTDGHAAFLRLRDDMLVAALPSFRKELEAASSSTQRDEIVRRYLGWVGDENLPIYLEYELVRMNLAP